MIRKIFLFINSPFDQRDYKRYGIELLRSNGFEVEIWDFFAYLNPRAFALLKETIQAQTAGYRSLTTLAQIDAALANLGPDGLIGFMFHLDHETRPIYKAVSATSIPYFIVSTNAIPREKTVPWKNIVARLRELTPQKFYTALQRRNPFLNQKMRPAAMIMTGGTKSLPPQPIDSRTPILWTHTMDYDIYLGLQKPPIAANPPIAVFLDSNAPFHPDFLLSGDTPYLSPEPYFAALRRFFDALEKQLQLKVVIAAHPRATYNPADRFFGDRPIYHDQTAQWVSQSRCVITHTSTSINFAVLFQKPIIFITVDKIEINREMQYAVAMARSFHKMPINIDRTTTLDVSKEMTVNEAAYAAYKESFIKKPDSPEKPLWQIVSDWLKAGSELRG